MTFGAPAPGEILADRYRLEEHLNDDSSGRQVWRGADVILRRPVAIILRYPGGDSSAEMLAAAVAASRVSHSNLVGVYDAIDEGERAYVVREWVDGVALRDYASPDPLSAARATTVARAVASAVAAIHATGIVHGNIHPGSVLIGTEGRVVLADARSDSDATPEDDIRAIGGILYFALTGHWPQEELPGATREDLPDAVRDSTSVLAAPRQVRAGVPAYVDELTMDLLDAKLTLPSAEVLAGELGRMDAEAEVDGALDTGYYDHESPLGFGAVTAAEPARPAGRKIAVGLVGLLVIAVVGLLIGARLLAPADAGGEQESSGTPTTGPAASQTGGASAPVALKADQLRIVDPGGDRTELSGVDKIVDGDVDTGWRSDKYDNDPKFGGLRDKTGMGVLINLGEAKRVSVEVTLSTAGASAEMRVGTADPGSSRAGDQQIVASYQKVQEYTDHNGTKMIFNLEQPAQYLLVWITSLPKVEDGPPPRFQIGVQEIAIRTL